MPALRASRPCVPCVRHRFSRFAAKATALGSPTGRVGPLRMNRGATRYLLALASAVAACAPSAQGAITSAAANDSCPDSLTPRSIALMNGRSLYHKDTLYLVDTTVAVGAVPEAETVAAIGHSPLGMFPAFVADFRAPLDSLLKLPPVPFELTPPEIRALAPIKIAPHRPERYPDRPGNCAAAVVSGIGYSPDGRVAAVYSGFNCQGGSGAGGVQIVERDARGCWKPRGAVILWSI